MTAYAIPVCDAVKAEIAARGQLISDPRVFMSRMTPDQLTAFAAFWWYVRVYVVVFVYRTCGKPGL